MLSAIAVLLCWTLVGLPTVAAAQVSSDQGEILFVCCLNNRPNRVGLIDPESGQIVVRALKGLDGMTIANWAPDGQSLLLMDHSKSQTDLYRYWVAEERVEPLLVAPSDDTSPDMSPDGGSVVFTRKLGDEEGGTSDLFVLDVSSGKERRLTHIKIPPPIAPIAEWSPSGDEILFDFRRHLWIAPADGGGPKKLPISQWRATDGSAEWSPDGSRIAFLRSLGEFGSPQIFVYARTTGELQQITDASLGAYSPTWSPDGSQIAYLAEREGSDNEIIVRDLISGKITTLTHNNVEELGVQWQPSPAVILPMTGAGVRSVLLLGIVMLGLGEVCIYGNTRVARRNHRSKANPQRSN